MVSRGRVMEMVGGIYAGLEMCWRVGGAGRRRDGLAGGRAVVRECGRGGGKFALHWVRGARWGRCRGRDGLDEDVSLDGLLKGRGDRAARRLEA